jgi:hypothetical protein
MGVTPGAEGAIQTGATGGGLGQVNMGMVALAGVALVGVLFLLKKKR